MSSKTDLAEDIRYYREAVSNSITPLLQQLGEELKRISSLPPGCHEKVAIALFGKKHYKDPRLFDYLKADADQWLRIVNDFLKILAKDDSPSYYPQTESRLVQYRRREELRAKELKDIISSISAFLPKIQEGFILESSFNYAQRKKCTTDGDDNLPFREDIVPFLCVIQQTDVILGDRIITHISKMVGPQFRDYLLTNNKAEAERCLPANYAKIRPILIEVAALQSGLSLCPQVYSALKKSIEVCGRIDDNYFIKEFNAKAELPDFPSTLYDDVRSELEKSQDQWTKEEYLAILGKEKKDHTFQYTEPQNKEYFPGLMEKYWYADIIRGIAKAVSSCECIDEQDEALFMYLFFGYGSIPSTQNRLYWKDQYDARKKDGTVRHPSELYYLLATLYKDVKKTFTLEFIEQHLEFSDKTMFLIKEIVPQGKLPQLAQRCNKQFRETIDAILNCQE